MNTTTKKILVLLGGAALLSACNGHKDYDATGIFEAETVTVAAETSGKILSMPVAEGDSITAGEVIAVIDTVMLELQERQIMSQHGAAAAAAPDITAQAAALRAQIAHQRSECDRFKRLLDRGATTQKNYDDACAYLTALQGQLDALLSTLGKNRSSVSSNAGAIQYQLEQIREQIERSTVKAPLSGVVLEKYARAGELTAAGRPLYKVADLDDIYLRSYFTVAQLADVKLGQQVTVIADFGADKRYEYPGRIVWIAQESEFTPKSIQTPDTRANLVYAVKIAVPNDGRLKLGQYGEVRI